MEKDTMMDNQQKNGGANCNAKISTGFYVFLVITAVIVVVGWLVLR